MHKINVTSKEQTQSNYYAPGPVCGDSSSLPDNTCNVETVAENQAVCVHVRYPDISNEGCHSVPSGVICKISEQRNFHYQLSGVLKCLSDAADLPVGVCDDVLLSNAALLTDWVRSLSIQHPQTYCKREPVDVTTVRPIIVTITNYIHCSLL